jgi:hypothetical protein
MGRGVKFSGSISTMILNTFLLISLFLIANSLASTYKTIKEEKAGDEVGAIFDRLKRTHVISENSEESPSNEIPKKPSSKIPFFKALSKKKSVGDKKKFLNSGTLSDSSTIYKVSRAIIDGKLINASQIPKGGSYTTSDKNYTVEWCEMGMKITCSQGIINSKVSIDEDLDTVIIYTIA